MQLGPIPKIETCNLPHSNAGRRERSNGFSLMELLYLMMAVIAADLRHEERLYLQAQPRMSLLAWLCKDGAFVSDRRDDHGHPPRTNHGS
jgi:hypothetical protein